MYGAGSALGDVNTQRLGDVLQSTVTDATIGGIGGGIVGGALKVKSNLATKRAEQQASLKLINQKSLLQKESDAVASQIDDMLSPEKVNEFERKDSTLIHQSSCEMLKVILMQECLMN